MIRPKLIRPAPVPILPPACVHTTDGTLCPSCRHEWEEDPTAYNEYGDHPEGLKRWRALQADMAARPPQPHRPLNIDESEAADDGDVLPW